MTTINSNFKAVGSEPLDVSGLGPNAPLPEVDNTQLQMDLAAALLQLDQFREENAQWLTDENLAEMNRIEVMMKAEVAAIEAYGAGGVAAGADGTSDEVMPQNLEPLWNGVPANGINQFDEDRNRLSADAAKYGEYVATVEIPNSGAIANPSRFAFQMTEDMVAVRGESIGRDIVITAEYQDGSRRSWIVRGGTVRAEPITISALGLSHGVQIDMRHVIRVSDGTNAAATQRYFQNIYIWGTDEADTIYGSQGRDKIAATGGDDTVYGMAGNDTIRGMAGNDTISGGAGEDILYGGEDFDTSFKSDEGDTINEFERGPVDDVVTDLPAAGSVFTSSSQLSPDGDRRSFDWVLSDEQEPGVMVIENTTSRGGTLDINMPDGYNMAYAERDASNGLVITFVGDEGTFKLKIQGFFSEFDSSSPAGRIARLNFHDSTGNDIIDFSRVGMLTHQVINIKADRGGEDIVLGAENEFVANGGSLEEMLRSQGNGNGDLAGYIDDGLFAPNDRERLTEYEAGDPATFGGYHAEINGDRQIVISDDTTALNADRDPVLRIEAPEGYEMGYITQDADGNKYVILIKPGVDGARAETVVIKIEASLGLGVDDIRVGNRIGTATDDDEDRDFRMEWFDLTSVSSDTADYSIDGGAGHDLLFAQKGSRIENADGDDVVERESATQGVSTDLSGAGDVDEGDDTPPADEGGGDDARDEEEGD